MTSLPHNLIGSATPGGAPNKNQLYAAIIVLDGLSLIMIFMTRFIE